MDNLIVAYIANYFTEDMQYELYKSFNIIEAYEYNDPYSMLINILTVELEDDDKKTIFLGRITFMLNEILENHTIVLTDEATFSETNTIADTLYNIQHLEDYSAIIELLESLETSDIILATILADHCGLSATKIMSIIDSYDDEVLVKLKAFIYAKEESDIEPMDVTAIRSKAILFFDKYGKDNAGYALIEGNVDLGLPFETYITMIGDSSITNSTIDQLAINLLSVILLSKEGSNDPLMTFRNHSELLVGDMKTINAVDSKILSLLTRLK